MDDVQRLLAALEIQNVMGRYVGANCSPKMADDVLALFDLNSVDVRISIAGGPEITGRAGVERYWRHLDAIRIANGGTLGAHLLTSPVIVVNDEDTASGQWQDLGTTLFGPGMPGAALDTPLAAQREVSRYSVEFVRREGRWLVHSLRWDVLWVWPHEPIDQSQNWIADTSRRVPAPPL